MRPSVVKQKAAGKLFSTHVTNFRRRCRHVPGQSRRRRHRGRFWRRRRYRRRRRCEHRQKCFVQKV